MKPLTKDEITRAASALAGKKLENPRNQAQIQTQIEMDFLETVPALSRASVLSKARDLYESNRTTQQNQVSTSSTSTTSPTAPNMTTETTTAAAEATTANPATETASEKASRERGANQVLTPKEKASHNVLHHLKQVQGLAKLDKFSSFDFAGLRTDAKLKDKSDEELMSYANAQFEQFGRKFLVGKGEKAEAKPLANDANESHPAALAVIKNAVIAAKEDKANANANGEPDAAKVNMAIAKQAAAILAGVKAVYVTAEAPKRQGKAAVRSFETVSWDML